MHLGDRRTRRKARHNKCIHFDCKTLEYIPSRSATAVALQFRVDHFAERGNDLVLALGLFGGGEGEDAALLLGRDDLQREVASTLKLEENERKRLGRTWFSLRMRTAFMRLCRLPLMTNPALSYFSIWSASIPISPRRGMRCPSAAYAAMAAPSPGRSAPPYALRFLAAPGPDSGIGPTSCSSSPSDPPPNAACDGASTHSSSSCPAASAGAVAATAAEVDAAMGASASAVAWRRLVACAASSAEDETDGERLRRELLP